MAPPLRRARVPGFPLAALSAILATGCAENLHALPRGAAGGGPPLSFWPPPEATSIWSADLGASADPGEGEPATSRSFGDVATCVDRAMSVAGYVDRRWFAVGAGYTHGFTLTTRLERAHADGTSLAGAARWAPRFPDAANLLWLNGARRITVAEGGRYRVFLVVFTDLPIGPDPRAAVWDAETWMEGGDETRPLDFPAAHRASPRYRLGVYVYEYESTPADSEGRFVEAGDARLPAAAHVARSGLGPGLLCGRAVAR